MIRLAQLSGSKYLTSYKIEKLNKGWKLKPFEIIPGPATIDEANVINFP